MKTTSTNPDVDKVKFVVEVHGHDFKELEDGHVVCKLCKAVWGRLL